MTHLSSTTSGTSTLLLVAAAAVVGAQWREQYDATRVERRRLAAKFSPYYFAVYRAIVGKIQARAHFSDETLQNLTQRRRVSTDFACRIGISLDATAPGLVVTRSPAPSPPL